MRRKWGRRLMVTKKDAREWEMEEGEEEYRKNLRSGMGDVQERNGRMY